MRVYYSGLCKGYEVEGGFDTTWIFITKTVGYNIMCRSRQGLLGENVPRFIRTIVLCAKLLLNIFIESMILFTRHHDYIPDDLILHLHTMMYVVRITKIATSKMS